MLTHYVDRTCWTGHTRGIIFYNVRSLEDPLHGTSLDVELMIAEAVSSVEKVQSHRSLFK